MSSKFSNYIHVTFTLILSLTLCACGGGGGGNSSGTNEPPITPNIVAPTISVQPQDLNASAGDSVSFSVTASGSGQLSYQWLRDGANVSGANSAQYTLPAVQITDSGSKWSVEVRNSAGNVTSVQATLKVSGSALLAGSSQAKGFVNGELVGIAQDGNGNTYVLDRSLDSFLLKVSSQGVITQLPLSARDSDAALYQPTGMTRDAAGNFYVTDRKCSVRKISPAGEITVLAGSAYSCGHSDGKGSDATFGMGITALAVDATSNVFVAGPDATIRKITPEGVVSTVAGTANAPGSADGAGSAARFGDVRSMAVDGAGNIFVTDSGIDGTAPSIRKITPSGIVMKMAGGISYGSADGQSGAASFYTLSGLAIDASGNLYTGDQGNHSIRKISPDGVVTTFAGQSTTQNPPDINPADGPAKSASFRQPVAMTIDGAGNIFVAEASPSLQFNALRKISVNGTVSTIAGTFAGSGTADGIGSMASFFTPHGLAIEANGKVWVADTGNQLIRQISTTGAVTTLAGTKGLGSFTEQGDGKGSLARFTQPLAIAVDSHGTAFVTDGGHRTLRKVLGDGTVTTLAGRVNTFGAVDGTGSAATFSEILGVTVDQAGMLYVTDMSAVRRVDPATGTVTTLAGKLGAFVQGSADGTGDAARFGYLPAIAIDTAGNLYVVDSGNNNVRKITPNGVVTTLAGRAGVTGSADGKGAAATFNKPQGIAVDKEGNVYVADTGNNLIRRIAPDGEVTTIAGQVGANGIVLGRLNNPLSQPTGLAFNSLGVLYVCANNGIFKLKP